MNSAKDSTAENHFKMKQPLQSPTMRLEKVKFDLSHQHASYLFLVLAL